MSILEKNSPASQEREKRSKTTYSLSKTGISKSYAIVNKDSLKFYVKLLQLFEVRVIFVVSFKLFFMFISKAFFLNFLYFQAEYFVILVRHNFIERPL